MTNKTFKNQSKKLQNNSKIKDFPPTEGDQVSKVPFDEIHSLFSVRGTFMRVKIHFRQMKQQ
jgi:hypothetical protein